MEFGRFADGVTLLWDETWPTVIFLLLSWQILKRCFPDSYQASTAVYKGAVLQLLGRNQLRRFFKNIGVSAAYPILMAIFLFLAVKMIRQLIFGLEILLPPNFIPADYQLAYMKFNAMDLAGLNHLFPDALDFRVAYERAQALLSDPADSLKSPRFVEVFLMLTKSLILTVIGLLLLCISRESRRWQSVWRAGCVIVFSTTIWGLCFVSSLQVYQQDILSSAEKLISKIRLRVSEEQKPNPFRLPTEVPEKFYMLYEGKRWWHWDCALLGMVRNGWLNCFPPPRPHWDRRRPFP